MESSAAQPPVANSTGKVRILLQTITHLVPGSDRPEKLAFIQNTVCQHHWKRDYDFAQERWYPYRDYFGLKNRKCFFLIDHHGHDHTIQEEKVPVLWYKWTGESLVRIYEDLPSRIQKELKKWPFTWEGRKFHRVPKGPDGKYDPMDYREIIKSKLYLGTPILKENIDFLREYPEHARWLRAHLYHELWVKIEPFCDLPGEGE
ncbi:hypothetical protein BGZ61DRAFT_356160 [Ilyonectria robusta]|uniref:uncharacterized protein n=1 Tax=Ilyonectria robusta TaxID=1079257 RepID=UPI001E8E1D5A|nr:uncharacterized protein BGZ61DRAFT_356160 [Ilyonectria robusta]KAH8685143.1 hypothetical protein BGZ61DRAFT_356160 [Ilyonectria robusta]